MSEWYMPGAPVLESEEKPEGARAEWCATGWRCVDCGGRMPYPEEGHVCEREAVSQGRRS